MTTFDHIFSLVDRVLKTQESNTSRSVGITSFMAINTGSVYGLFNTVLTDSVDNYPA